jgi:hypothetical protein
MFFYGIIYVMALAGIGICAVKDPAWRVSLQKIYFFLLLAFLILFAGIRSADIDRDYINYLQWFTEISTGPLTLLDWIKDPAFVLISFPFARLGFNYAVALTIIVAIALVAKLHFARITSDPRWLTLFFYIFVCRFFLDQEMTAVRAAAAIPFMSMSILFAYRGKNTESVLMFIGGLAFHLSAIAALPILILIFFGVRFRSIWWMILLVPSGVAAYLSLRGLLEAVATFSRFSPYLSDNPEVEMRSINLFSIYLLAHVLVLVFVTWRYWKELSDEERMITFCSGFGVFGQLVLYSNDILALRVAELFALFDILLFLIPFRHSKRAFSMAYLAFLVVLGAALFLSTARIMKPYDWIFSSTSPAQGVLQTREQGSALPGNYRKQAKQIAGPSTWSGW